LIALPFLLRRLRELHIVDESGEEALVREGILTLADLHLAIEEERPVAANHSLRRAAAVLAGSRGRFRSGAPGTCSTA